jgi:hypothetical protein
MISYFLHLQNFNILIILLKATQFLHKRAGIAFLCSENPLMMAPRCRNMWEFYTFEYILLIL